MIVVYSEAVVVTVTGLLHFLVLVTREVIYVFVMVCEDRDTKTDCSVWVTVVVGSGKANGQGMTVDTKS